MERAEGIREGLTRRGMLATAAAAVWAWPVGEVQPPGPGPSFRVGADRPGGASRDAVFRSSFIEHDPPVAFVHCPSVCVQRDGRVLCAWYAGSREGARDVGVWLSEAETAADEGGTGPLAWTRPRVVVDRGQASRQLGRFVDKVGNSVLFTDAADRVWLVFVTIAVGGWSGSSLNACLSPDGGRTWNPPHRLALSPFFNISELVRAAPAMLDGGGIALPAYHECIGKFPEMVWLEPRGDSLVATKTRMTGGRTLLQPTIVPLADRTAIAFLRDQSDRRRVFLQHSSDAGESWSSPVPTLLANPHSSMAAIRLDDGRIMLALNDSSTGRDRLSLVVSSVVPPADSLDAWAREGEWGRIATLDEEPNMLFAYPFMVRDDRGFFHLVYSWKMKRIRHVFFNEAWIDSKPVEAMS